METREPLHTMVLVGRIERLEQLAREYIEHCARYTELYHTGRAWEWVEEGQRLEKRAKKEFEP